MKKMLYVEERYNIEKTININNILYELNANGDARVVDQKLDEITFLEIEETIEYKDKTYTVVSIGEDAFKDCKYLDYAIFPSTIREVGSNSFNGSSVKEVHFTHAIRGDEVVFHEGVFMDAIRLEEVYLPPSLKEIPNFTFTNAISLVKVNMPWRVKRIGDMAYFNCKSLCHIDFPIELIEIGDSSFQSSNIHYAEIQDGVKKIGNLAFADIDNLRSIVIEGSNAEFGDYFMKNDQRVITYIRGIEGTKELEELKSKIASHHYIVIDNFVMYEDEGIKYILFSKKVARVVGYSEEDIRPHTHILDRIGTAIVTDFAPRCFNYSNKLVSCNFPKSIVRTKGKVFEHCLNMETVIFSHYIKDDEAKWVVSNDQVEIVYLKQSHKQTYKAKIEHTTQMDDGTSLENIDLQLFVGYTKEEVLSDIKEFCRLNSDENNQYKLLNLYIEVDISQW